MLNKLRSAIVGLLIIGLLAVPTGAQALAPTTETIGPWRFHGTTLTADQRKGVQTLYTQSDFPWPILDTPIDVYVQEDMGGDYAGYSWVTITIASWLHDDIFARILLHETGHIFDYRLMTSAQRESFMLDGQIWRAQSIDYWQRPVEMFARGLMQAYSPETYNWLAYRPYYNPDQVRAVVSSNVEANGTTFTDISDQSADVQTAIARIWRVGVTIGTSKTTYSPNDLVTQEQYSLFAERIFGLTGWILGIPAQNVTRAQMAVTLAAALDY